MVGRFMKTRQVRIVALCASVFLSIPTVSFAANAIPKPKVSGPTKAQIAAAQIAATQAAKKAQIAAAQVAENAKAVAAASAANQLKSAQNILQQLEEITIHKQAELNSAQIALHGATSRSNVASAHAT